MKKIIRTVFKNGSSGQKYITFLSSHNIKEGAYLKVAGKTETIICRIFLNSNNGQKSLTIPEKSQIEEGEEVEITKVRL